DLAVRVDNVLTFFFSSRRRHTRFSRDWSSDVCSSDLSTIVRPRRSTPSNTTKIEGKNVQLLGDPMLNNCASTGSPANSATMLGEIGRASCREIEERPGAG